MGNCVGNVRHKINIRQLMRVHPDSVDLFSLKGNVYPCRIVSVYDGDTCTALFKMENQFVKFKVRMLGYDSPEMKPRLNLLNRDQIKREAEEAKQALISKTKDRHVKIECGDWDKYGRLLGTLYTNETNININEWMINGGYGYPYDGGKKR